MANEIMTTAPGILAPIDDEPGPFTQHMRAAIAQQTAAYQEHQELKRLYALALAEIEQLRSQVSRYQRGEGVTVEISGRRFALQSPTSSGIWNTRELLGGNVRDELSRKLAAWSDPAMPKPSSSDWLNDQPPKHEPAPAPDGSLPLHDSYILSKDKD